MPITEELMDTGDWAVGLDPNTPKAVLDDIDVRTYAFASIVITPHHLETYDHTAAAILAQARYTGVYLASSDGRLNLEGGGLAWWLGDENDGGDLRTGADGVTTNFDLEDQLDARVFGNSNGLTKGTVDSLGTLRTMKVVMGTTRRQFLDTICAAYPSGPYEWRINPGGTVDVNQQADLYATTATPTTVLTQEGGREGAITGLRADLDLAAIDVSDYRSAMYVNWNDTPADHGIATNTPPAGWKNFGGTAPALLGFLTWKPKPFLDRDRWHRYRQGTRAWRRGLNTAAAAYAAWTVNSNVQATQVATKAAVDVSGANLELGADVGDVYDPWRFVQVGDSVFVYDLDLGLTDTANEVYYRGAVIHPKKVRVHAVTTPIREGYGVYLRYWNGSAFAMYDLTPYVAWEEGDTSYELGTRARLHRQNARPRRINRRKIRRDARQMYLLDQYLQQT